MDVARAPMGYRDVPSGRASVAGEFARVARLHRARMSGQAFLVTFVATDKSDSPEGRNKKHQRTRSGALHQAPKFLGYSPSGQRKRCSRWSRVPRSRE